MQTFPTLNIIMAMTSEFMTLWLCEVSLVVTDCGMCVIFFLSSQCLNLFDCYHVMMHWISKEASM